MIIIIEGCWVYVGFGSRKPRWNFQKIKDPMETGAERSSFHLVRIEIQQMRILRSIALTLNIGVV